MTQFQYDIIVKTICNGASALADELCTSLAEVVNERNEFKKKLDLIGQPEKEANEVEREG